MHLNSRHAVVSAGRSLFDYADALEVQVPTSCRKQGKCKECMVEVVEGSPAAEAGLRPEDLIVELNGAPVETVDDIQRVMVGDLIGAHVHARVLREGSERELELVPVELVS